MNLIRESTINGLLAEFPKCPVRALAEAIDAEAQIPGRVRSPDGLLRVRVRQWRPERGSPTVSARPKLVCCECRAPMNSEADLAAHWQPFEAAVARLRFDGPGLEAAVGVEFCRSYERQARYWAAIWAAQ